MCACMYLLQHQCTSYVLTVISNNSVVSEGLADIECAGLTRPHLQVVLRTTTVRPPTEIYIPYQVLSNNNRLFSGGAPRKLD